ncbi:orotidine-5'-phosphate decarboxylase [Candidatus Poribacteria bacterium]|nr:MAG: orotidine-5'-phosphate decarboxylase [Candidatus Poribacteria bacterium]
MSSSQKLIVALDLPTLGRAIELVEALGDLVQIYKIGPYLFLEEGRGLIDELKKRGKGVFLDLKFHNIPNTVAGAARAVVRMGVDMFNLHAAGGPEMMRAAREAAVEEAERLGFDPPLILGVTILTSLSDEDLRGIYGAELSARRLVERMALLAKEAGLDGVVASPGEIGIVKGACGEGFAVVVPGVRPSWAARADQKRVATPGEAVRMGADYIVVGRPIYASPDPVEAAMKIIEEIGG